MTDVAAADRWAASLAGWGLPDRILAGVRDSPFEQPSPRFALDARIDRDTVSAHWAREVLPPVGATVLDVGCGAGKASLALVPLVSELIGVDRRGAMLDEFVAAAAAAGVARRTVHGDWPEVADRTPTADVVVCHHVVYDVADIAPFLWALTERARLAVVLEMTAVHPMTVWSPAFDHFWDLRRPDGPTSEDLLAVLRDLSIDPEVTTSPREPRSTDANDLDGLLPIARRRLCLTGAHDDELRRFLADHPPVWPDTMVTIRWPGAADAPT